jgi:hypothetical protein
VAPRKDAAKADDGLQGLERQILMQRERVAEDRRRIERLFSELPSKALDNIATPEGLLVSFSLGAAAAVIAPTRNSVGSVVLWDLLGRLAIEGLPAIGNFIRELARDRAVRRGSGE